MLFFSSYAPLGVIMCVMSFTHNRSLSVVFLSVSILSVFSLWYYLKMTLAFEPIPLTTSDVKRTDGDTMSYIASYLIPFVAAPFQLTEQSIGLFLFFLVIAILYVNSGMIHINPTLNFLGWRIYEITSEDGKEYSIITKRRLCKKESLKVVNIAEDVFVEIER